MQQKNLTLGRQPPFALLTFHSKSLETPRTFPFLRSFFDRAVRVEVLWIGGST